MHKDVIAQAARSAGKAMLSKKPDEGVVTKGGRANIVTAADLVSEKVLIDTIKKYFPNDPILSEETESSLNDPLSLDKLWVIDPIDGTNNFRYQRNYSSISIGYIEKGIIKHAAIYDPFRDELFAAEYQHGAYLNDLKINVSDQTKLSKASVATDNSYDPSGTRHNLELFLKINPSPWVMIKGSAVLTLCELACGRVDVYFHTYMKPWDNAAAQLIVQEAGGILRDFNGNKINFLSSDIVAGNKTLVEQCISALKT